MHAKMVVARTVLCEFDGTTWTSSDAKLATQLNGLPWRGERHSKYGLAGSHVMEVAKLYHAKITQLSDTPTNVSDIK